MAEPSVADESADIGKGLEESLGCVVAGFFYISPIIFSSVVIFGIIS
jgi:hypothetical protein